MLLRHSLANQVLVDSVTTAVTTANEPHEVEAIELHTRLSSTTDGDGGGAEDATGDTGAEPPETDVSAVDGTDDAPAVSGQRQED